MASEIHDITLTIKFQSWIPFDKELNREIDDLLGGIRAKRYLAHAGNVHTTIQDETK